MPSPRRALWRASALSRSGRGRRGQILLSAALLFLASCQRAERPFIATGIFEATETTVSSEATGRILELDVEEGQTLRAGEPVGKVECLQLSLTRAQIETGLSGLDARRVDLPLQLAALSEQLASAKREQARVAALRKGGAATDQQQEQLDTQVATLTRQIAATRATLANSNTGVSFEAAVTQLRIEQLDDQLAKCTLVAPVGGTVLVKYARQGELATLGRPLFKLGDMENLFLRAYVTSDQLASLKLGQTLKVESDFGTDKNRVYEGTLAWISTQSEFTPRSIQTHDERADLVYAIKVAVKNDGFLKLGMHGFIPAERP